MSKYIVTIKEISSQRVEVDAKSKKEAIEKVAQGEGTYLGDEEIIEVLPWPVEKLSETTVICQCCHEKTPSKTAHLHGDGWIGECCWDERLRSSE